MPTPPPWCFFDLKNVNISLHPDSTHHYHPVFAPAHRTWSLGWVSCLQCDLSPSGSKVRSENVKSHFFDKSVGTVCGPPASPKLIFIRSKPPNLVDKHPDWWSEPNLEGSRGVKKSMKFWLFKSVTDRPQSEGLISEREVLVGKVSAVPRDLPRTSQK